MEHIVKKSENVQLEVWMQLAEMKNLLAVCERSMEAASGITLEEAESVIRICRRMAEELVALLDKECG